MSEISSKFRFGLAWTLFCLAVIMVAGCKREDSSSTITSLAIDGFPSAIWQDEVVTFADPAFGLAVDLPSDWTIRPRIEGATNPDPIDSLSSPCLNWSPDVLPPCTVIQLHLGPYPVQSVERMRELAREGVESSGATVVLEEQEMNLQGLPALWLKIEDESISEYPAVHVVILVGKQIVYVNVYGELSPAVDIVNSIRPIQDATSSTE